MKLSKKVTEYWSFWNCERWSQIIQRLGSCVEWLTRGVILPQDTCY